MEHPITPPPTELVLQWVRQWQQAPYQAKDIYRHIATAAAQWGADQELEACCEWLKDNLDAYWATSLRAARRLKPPSLKEQALEQLGCIQTDLNKFGMGICTDTIRRALEQLND